MHFEHDWSLKAKLKQYNVNIFEDDPARNLTTGREIDREVIDGRLHAEDVGNKRFIAFVQDRLVESKKLFFERICKVRLKTGSEKKKGVLKSLSVLKEDCQAFSLLLNKTEKLAQAFKYPISFVPLAVASPELTLYQSDKAGLRNYIISLSKSSSHTYPRDAQWVVDKMVAIHSVPPSGTYEEWFKTLVKFITPPAEARATSLENIMDTYLEFSVKEGTR